MEQEWILSVSDLNEYVRRSLAADPMLHNLRLRGEISNFKRHSSGHWYFTLKDEDSRINCVMFRQNNMGVSIRPADGMAVIVSGSVSLYVQGGAYQFYVDAMRPDGVGSLYLRYEALKAKLAKEGLFDAGRKRPLPLLPRGIAIVTSLTGAVLHDIRTVSARRNPAIPLALLPVRVQGEGAAEEIAAAIRKAGTLSNIDVLITGRGGGSMEDLWAFNEECVVRAIAECPVPVISAVGHETDTTLADYAADVRAATPSMAAELAVQDRLELLGEVAALRQQLTKNMEYRLSEEAQRLAHLRTRLAGCHPAQRLAQQEHQMDKLRTRLNTAAQARVTALTASVAEYRAKLTALGPMAVLGRGYVLAMHAGKPVTTAVMARQIGRMELHFQDGALNVTAEGERTHGNEKESDL